MNRNLLLPFGLSLVHDPTKLLPSMIEKECLEIVVKFNVSPKLVHGYVT